MKAFGKALCAIALTTAALTCSQGAFAQAAPITCGDPINKTKVVNLQPVDTKERLEVVGNCVVGVVAGVGTYKFGDVNIYGGGKLTFKDEIVDFWAKNIVVEDEGSLLAGIDTPIGTAGGKITIHLYGPDQNLATGSVGVDCIQKYCGIPNDTWISNGDRRVQIPSPIPGKPDRTVPGFFYQYGPLMYDGGKLPDTSKQGTDYGFFGYKVLAVSYGGTLRLFGSKGVKVGIDKDVKDSGLSWARLKGTVKVGAMKLTVDRPVVVSSSPKGPSWAAGDHIVLTTTDYLPGHSEELEILSIDPDGQTINLKQAVKYRHQGEVYPLRADMGRLNLGASRASIETRAAVGLLSRSIQIVSEGATATTGGFPEVAGVYFGGHMIARQGFKAVQVQGVEFKQMGQGGRIGHYPVHFHHVQDTPQDTYIKDSSVNESMTRFMTLHATNGVTLARNVAWKSIGHGFYIEDGNEIDNRLLTNLAVYARSPLKGQPTVNPREVPGILAADRNGDEQDHVPFYTDVDHPTLFWITNGWNDFEYNMAAGASMCGACYWLLAAANSGHSRHEPMVSNLRGYSGQQASLVSTEPGKIVDNPLSRAGLTPLRNFVGNSCTGAMNSFNTVGDTTACVGAGFNAPMVAVVPNPFQLPKRCNQENPVVRDKDGVVIGFTSEACANPANMEADMYYPKVTGLRNASVCATEDDCRATLAPAAACSRTSLDKCVVTVVDGYTSSFHMGAETNFGAIWLRGPSWFLFTNSALTDAQNAGFSMVSGGGYTASDVLPGRWALVRKTVFVGATQDYTRADASGFASPYGPFNDGAKGIYPKGLPIGAATCNGNHCLSAEEGISVPVNNFVMSQRLFNIYDGPTYQDSNAYLDIKKLPITDCGLSPSGAMCPSKTLAGRVLGLPYEAGLGCFMPNAAIAWKQPNGFYYPPAFHSLNLYFDVDIRHFVIEPLFTDGTYNLDLDQIKLKYCNWNDALFTGYTDVDRQTELSDDDGSLTGNQQTVSVNNDRFFTAPTEEVECESDNTAKTSPYDYVTAVVYPSCAINNSCCLQGFPCDKDPVVRWWDQACTTESCYGVKMFRQLRINAQDKPSFIRMAGQDRWQRSTLAPNNGKFYIDTTVSAAVQKVGPIKQINEFREGENYYLFLLYAKTDTTQIYQIYVGDNFNMDDAGQLWATRVKVANFPVDKPEATTWPTTWKKEYANGILTVTLSMNFDDFKKDYKDTFKELCAPSTFCSWSVDKKLPTGGTCGCNTKGDFAKQCGDLNNSGQNVCAAWAQKDVDCPQDGCYGIGFKMAKMTYDVDKRPPAGDYPAGLPWSKPFVPAEGGIAQSCTPKKPALSQRR